MLITPIPRRVAHGFMIIEFMIGIVLVLFVVAGMMTFLAGNLAQYSSNVAQFRRVQQFDTLVRIVENELRRAGYDPKNIQGSPPPELVKNPNNLQFQDNCILYSYDRSSDGTIANLVGQPVEMSGVRIKEDTGIDNGRLQSWFATTGVPACNSNTGWIDLSSPNNLVFDSLQLCDAATSDNQTCKPITANTALSALGITIRAHATNRSDIVIQRYDVVDLPNGLTAKAL